MPREIQALKSSLYYELTSPICQERTDQTIYLDFIDYSNMDYYTSVKRKKSAYIPLPLYNYGDELFHLWLGEPSFTQLYREFLTEALLIECNNSACYYLIDNQKGEMIPDSACRLEVRVKKNGMCARIKPDQSSIPWFEGEMLRVVNNKTRPAVSSLAISIRLTQKGDCLFDKTYSTGYQQTTKAQRSEGSPFANAACLGNTTECLSTVTREIMREISRNIHLILSLQPKSKH